MREANNDIQVLTNEQTAIRDGQKDRKTDDMRVRNSIVEKLSTAFAPLRLDVVDDSHRHEGHAGHRPGGESHFSISIVAEAFSGKSRIERHRMINEILREEFEGGVHELAIEALAPGETERR